MASKLFVYDQLGRLVTIRLAPGLARDGDRLLAVNSQLSHPPGTPPFTVSTIPDPLTR